jgi:hypothetical protein
MFIRTLLLFSSIITLVGCDRDRQAREKVADVIRSEFGTAANPRVGFLGDSTHLLIHVDTTPFAQMSDSAFGRRAREIASLAMREYPRAGELDSISVGAIYAPIQSRRPRTTDTTGRKIYRPPDPTADPTMLRKVQRQFAFPVELLKH